MWNKRIVYTVLNPVRANLVKKHSDWTGLCAWSGNTDGKRTFRRFRRRAYDRACYLSQSQVERDDFYSTATLEVAEAPDPEKVQQRIREAEDAAKDQPVLGMDRVREASPFDHPARSKRGRMPICHASTPDLWRSFLTGWKAFVRAYRAASRAYRDGDLTTLFPDFSFRPSLRAT